MQGRRLKQRIVATITVVLILLSAAGAVLLDSVWARVVSIVLAAASLLVFRGAWIYGKWIENAAWFLRLRYSKQLMVLLASGRKHPRTFAGLCVKLADFFLWSNSSKWLEEITLASADYEVTKRECRQPLVVRRENVTASYWTDKAFAIVLLRNEVRLSRGTDGVCTLAVDLRDESGSIYNNWGKRFLADHYLGDDSSHAERKKEALDNAEKAHQFMLGRGGDSMAVSGHPMPLRWASGGGIAFAKYLKRWWCVLFFRDIKPIGWNVPNGASEDKDEYKDIGFLACRELAEELMVLRTKPEPGLDAGLDVKQRPLVLPDAISERVDRDILGVKFSSNHRDLRQEQDGFTVRVEDSESIPLKHVDGAPCRVEVLYHDEDRQSVPAKPREGVVVSVNPTEFGIEVIVPVEFEMADTDCIIDGEILETHRALVRRPVMLLSVDYLRRVWETTGGLGKRLLKDPHLDCKLLPNAIPSTEYTLFNADMALRKAMVDRNDSAIRPDVLSQARDWLRDYEHVFDELGDGDYPIVNKDLRTLCPVTWKTLEVLLAHNCLSNL